MDNYSLFRGYEKLPSTSDYPRTTLENGFFFLQLAFCSEGETRGVNVPLTLELSGFGEIIRIVVPEFHRYDPQGRQLSVLQDRLLNAKPPVQCSYSQEKDELCLTFLEESTKTQKLVKGLFVFNPEGDLTTVVARLRS